MNYHALMRMVFELDGGGRVVMIKEEVVPFVPVVGLNFTWDVRDGAVGNPVSKVFWAPQHNRFEVNLEDISDFGDDFSDLLPSLRSIGWLVSYSTVNRINEDAEAEQVESGKSLAPVDAE